jgi:hypothetical protein
VSGDKNVEKTVVGLWGLSTILKVIWEMLNNLKNN